MEQDDIEGSSGDLKASIRMGKAHNPLIET